MRLEYEVIQVKSTWQETQDELNYMAKKGWRLVCSYAHGDWFVMERKKRGSK